MKVRSITTKEFNNVMDMCRRNLKIRSVTPTIHPGTGIVYEIIIHTHEESKKFSVVNNDNPEYSLYEDVVNYIENLCLINYNVINS